jgi:hypothetical protein
MRIISVSERKRQCEKRLDERQKNRVAARLTADGLLAIYLKARAWIVKTDACRTGQQRATVCTAEYKTTLKVRAHWSAGDGRTDAAHGDKIFFPLLVTYHRTLIRTGRNGVRQFRLGFWEGNLFPSGRRVRLTQRWSYRIAWRDTEGKMLMLLANQRPALKWIASARRRKYDAVYLLSKNIATRPMLPLRPLRSSVRVPLLFIRDVHRPVQQVLYCPYTLRLHVTRIQHFIPPWRLNEAGSTKNLILATKLHGVTYKITVIFTRSLFFAQVDLWCYK